MFILFSFQRQTTHNNKNWTTDEAIEYCKTYFESLEAYKLCRQIPTSHTSISLENCILDIQVRMLHTFYYIIEI